MTTGKMEKNRQGQPGKMKVNTLAWHGETSVSLMIDNTQDSRLDRQNQHMARSIIHVHKLFTQVSLVIEIDSITV